MQLPVNANERRATRQTRAQTTRKERKENQAGDLSKLDNSRLGLFSLEPEGMGRAGLRIEEARRAPAGARAGASTGIVIVGRTAKSGLERERGSAKLER